MRITLDKDAFLPLLEDCRVLEARGLEEIVCMLASCKNTKRFFLPKEY